MEYDRAAVLEAWKKAVNRGVIDTAKLRPEIARAWARCMSLGVDPWSSDFSKSDEALLAFEVVPTRAKTADAPDGRGQVVLPAELADHVAL